MNTDSRLIEYQEFQRMRDEFVHQKHWETEYRSQTKELLLNELLNQQENDYPLMKGEPKDQRQFNALVSELEAKAETPWLKEVLKGLRFGAAATYTTIFDAVVRP